ncbi:hypothetical protein KP803_11960 [Vibrio sp. ZSDE26]|uniref:Uncharacterized protein n=1 Tax=Vibrio amylolyticus TaxID=2847292 RepID=A0A9X1XKS6_9VIBR|nr:hypothetical protein [Vibrio amylolyticus]MCK6263985.1 hypothetical protein [Vibrio amylolyticus]
MSTLEQVCNDVGLAQLPQVIAKQILWAEWQASQQPLFTRVLENKPETEVSLHLLGLLTKSHIELMASFASHIESITQMKKAIGESVGGEHVNKFKTSHIDELVLITHAWMYIQGHLSMDFSLANDHAQQTANLLTKLSTKDTQQLRSEFLKSFYAGKPQSSTSENSSLWDKIKRLFSH